MSRAAIALVLVWTFAVPEAYAQDEGGEGAQRRTVHVLQQRPFLQSLRVEVTPQFGYTINEVLTEYLQVGGTLRFHINEEIAIGGRYGHYFASETDAFHQVQDDFALFPEKSFIEWYAGGEVDYSPLYGKFILFGAATVHWNAFFTLGAGVTKTGAEKPLFTGMLGFGSRLFLTRWLTLNLEIKDFIYSEPFKNGDEILNNVVLYTGLSIFIPFTWNYKFPK